MSIAVFSEKAHAPNAALQENRGPIAYRESTVMARNVAGMGKTSLAEKIRRLRKDMGLSQLAFGAEVGADQSNVSKWERGEDTPSTEFAIKMADMAGQSVAEFLGLPRAGHDKASGKETLRIVGEVEAGAWKETIEWDSDDQIETPYPPGVSTNIALLAFRVVGSSMNRVYPDRSTVYVTSVGRTTRLRSGQKVLVSRRSNDGLYEATIKEYVVLEDGSRWLWPRSRDPEHQAPVPVGHKKSEDISIIGIVVAATVLEEHR